MYLPTTLPAMADVFYLYYRENGLTEIPAEWNEGWIRGDCRCPEHTRDSLGMDLKELGR